jgi:hypothetical protein
MNTKDIEDLKRVDAIIERHARAMRDADEARIEPIMYRFEDDDPGEPTGRHQIVCTLDDEALERVLAVAQDAMADFGREWEKRQRRQIDLMVEGITKVEQFDSLSAAIKSVVHASKFTARANKNTIELLGFDPNCGSISQRTAQRILDAFRSECAAVREECLSELRAMGLTVEG